MELIQNNYDLIGLLLLLGIGFSQSMRTKKLGYKDYKAFKPKNIKEMTNEPI